MATGGQQQGQMLLANQDQYLSARSEALQNVERTITELGGIFQQLATMVAEQGEMAVRIDENVERSVANVDSAQTQLLKYLNSISSNKMAHHEDLRGAHLVPGVLRGVHRVRRRRGGKENRAEGDR